MSGPGKTTALADPARHACRTVDISGIRRLGRRATIASSGSRASRCPPRWYRLGDDVAVDPDGGAISAADFAIGFVDVIEKNDHHRAHINLGH